MTLTDIQIRQASPNTKPIKLTDGHGLYLEIKPNGSKLWRYRYRIGGKQNTFAIGRYPDISITQARDQRRNARKLVTQGIHPSRHRKKINIAKLGATFDVVYREWYEQRIKSWSPRYSAQVKRVFETDVLPKIGHMPIQQIETDQLLKIVKSVENRGAESIALLIRQWTDSIWRYAIQTLRAKNNPANALRGVVHKPKTQHAKVLNQQQLRELVNRIRPARGILLSHTALELLLLTFVRKNEMLGALWREIDWSSAEWHIPATRMKMREPHIVPLATQTIDLLHVLHRCTGHTDYLFPNAHDSQRPMHEKTPNTTLRKLGFNGPGTIGFTAHGFRGTASTLLYGLGCHKDHLERQFAHAERDKVRASYNHAQYLPERREIMQAWANLIDDIATQGEPHGTA